MNAALIASGKKVDISSNLLEKDPTMSAADLKFYLRNGAEKVTYSYTGGISNEFAYGRVHCHKSLNLVVDIDHELSHYQEINYSVSNGRLELFGINDVSEVKLYNILGQELVIDKIDMNGDNLNIFFTGNEGDLIFIDFQYLGKRYVIKAVQF